MIKKILKYILFFTLIFLISCATTVKVKLLKPAEINLGIRKKIAVLNFGFTGDIDELSYGSYIPSNYITSNLSENIIQYLVDNQHFTVVEREQLENVIKEQSLYTTGFTDKNELNKLGKLYGVEAIIVGSGSYYLKDEVSRTDESKVLPDRTIFYKEITITRKVILKAVYKIIDTETGQIIASRTNEGTEYQYLPAFPEKGTERVEFKSSNVPGNIYGNPFNNNHPSPVPHEEIKYFSIQEKVYQLNNWQEMINRATQKIAYSTVYQIAPHFVTEDREIKDGNTKEMKDGLEFAGKNLWGSAMASWEAVLSNNSPEAINDKTNALYNLAVYYEINGEMDSAESYFQEAYKNSGEKKYERDIERIQNRKKELGILKNQGRQNDLENQPDDENYIKKAEGFVTSGQTEKAINSYIEALSKEPDNDSIYYNLGLLYKKRRNNDKAISSFKKATGINPSNGKAYEELGKIYSETGNMDEAYNAFKEAARFKPELNSENTKDHPKMGMKYQREGNYNLAIQEYKLALADKANDPDIYNNLGAVYYLQGNYPEAIKHYQEAIKYSPDSSKYYNLALCYHSQGKFKEATVEYKKSCEMGFKPSCDALKELEK
jgi:tetratricopeptide (TPR) repeat protein